MGILLTEKFRRAFDGRPEALAKTADTPNARFTGQVIDALHHDPT